MKLFKTIEELQQALTIAVKNYAYITLVNNSLLLLIMKTFFRLFLLPDWYK